MHNLLLLPEYRLKHGYGHIIRLLRYKQAHFPNAKFLIETDAQANRLRQASRDITPENYCFVDDVSGKNNILLIDKPVITTKDYRRYCRFANITVGLDSRGRGARYIDYIIDMLPRIKGQVGNITDPNLLPLVRGAQNQQKQRGCLIYFSGNRRKELMSRAYQFARRELCMAHDDVTGVLVSEDEKLPHDMRGIYAPAALAQHLPQYKTIITAFGITALEGLQASASVYLLNPTRYHVRVARKAGFRFMHAPRFTGMLSIRTKIMTHPKMQVPKKTTGNANIKDIIRKISDSHPLSCPACSHAPAAAQSRSGYRTLVRCDNCKLLYFKLHGLQPVNYSDTYFSTSYKDRYGKNYLNDFDKIVSASHTRIKYIKRLVKTAHPTLLDIGCAYGAFMHAASQYNFSVHGIDLDKQAVRYITDVLKYSARVDGIQNFNIPAEFDLGTFSVISMWYVIEHFDNVREVLQKINHLLPIGGVFALSTPNPHSIVDACYTDYSPSSSPAEHYSLISKKDMRRILNEWGFKIRFIVNHGHHPELFPRTSPVISTAISNFLHLGTTYSVYAQKIVSV